MRLTTIAKLKQKNITYSDFFVVGSHGHCSIPNGMIRCKTCGQMGGKIRLWHCVISPCAIKGAYVVGGGIFCVNSGSWNKLVGVYCPVGFLSDVLGTLRDTTRTGGLQQRGLICVHSIIVVLRVDSLLVTPTLVANVIAYFRAPPAFTILVNGGPLRGYASNFIHTLHAHHGLLTFGILFPIIPKSSDFIPSDRFDLRCRHCNSWFPFLKPL